MREISRVWNTFVFSLLLFILSHTVSGRAFSDANSCLKTFDNATQKEHEHFSALAGFELSSGKTFCCSTGSLYKRSVGS